MAKINKFEDFDKTNENHEEDRFISDDGWNCDELEEIGLIDWLDKVQEVSYEVKNCRRGSYAIPGATADDLISYLNLLREELDEVINNME
jgi:hypothetical protein